MNAVSCCLQRPAVQAEAVGGALHELLLLNRRRQSRRARWEAGRLLLPHPALVCPACTPGCSCSTLRSEGVLSTDWLIGGRPRISMMECRAIRRFQQGRGALRPCFLDRRVWAKPAGGLQPFAGANNTLKLQTRSLE